MARGRDGLHKRGGVFGFRYKTTDGEWREKLCGTADRVEARKFRTRFLSELERGVLPGEMSEWHLSAAEAWWIEYRSPRIAAGTMNSERYRLQWLAQILGDLRLCEITNTHLERYQNARLSKNISAHSINKETTLWAQILRRARLWHRLAEDFRSIRTKPSDIGQAVSREQLRNLGQIAQKKKIWEAAFYGSVLAVNTGLRGGEIKRLKIGHVDVLNRRLNIRRDSAKTAGSVRTIELNRDALEAAERLLLRARLLGATQPDHFLLPKNRSKVKRGGGEGQRGYDPTQPMTDWGAAWKTLVEKAGLGSFRFHDLRHTAITHLLERGTPLATVEALVGHLSVKMLRHYTHISSGWIRKAVDTLDDDPILVEKLPNPASSEPPAESQPLATRTIQ